MTVMNNLHHWHTMLHMMLAELQKRCQKRDPNCYVQVRDGQMGGVMFLIHSSGGLEVHEVVEDMSRRLVIAY